MRFIGPLSRFSGGRAEPSQLHATNYELVGMASGPEPHRSLLVRELSKIFASSGKKSLILSGIPGMADEKTFGNLTILSHMESGMLKQVLCQAKRLFLRSGYSTIMDLHALGKTATVIPTPGQTEQEYLATLHSDSGWLIRANQGHLNL